MLPKNSKTENRMFTYKTYLKLGGNDFPVLNATASLLSQISRSLFHDITSGKEISLLKKEYLLRFGITARQFNSCRVGVEGIIKSQTELMKQRVQDLAADIEYLEKSIKTLSLKQKNRLKIQSKRKRLIRLNHKLVKVKDDLKKGKCRLCFGGKKLFNAQFDLEKSGYSSHEEWRRDWKNSRDNAFFLIGSKDETAGNQSCRATIQSDGKLTLRLRIPNALHGQYGKYLTITNVHFPYGHEHVVAAIQNCLKRGELKDLMSGTPISYRFTRQKKGWYIAASVSLSEPKWRTHHRQGVFGVDINIDHLAVTELDRCGNPLKRMNIPLVLYGKSTEQAKAIIGDACSEVVKIAESAQKDIVIEDLDFTRKRKTLREHTSSMARTLSSFAYNKIIQTIKSRGYRFGVKIHQVNPCYTSIIGKVKYASKYGLTIHQAASLCIGRRYYGFSERSPCGQVSIPDGKGNHVAFDVPVRNRRKHAWSHWGAIDRKFRAVHVAHKRAVVNRSKATASLKLCDDDSSLVVSETLIANRWQHCSANVPIFA
jgi:IS605 OrfB family transposase